MSARMKLLPILGMIVPILGTACSAPTRVVEVPVAVEVPGPVQWRPIPEDLLRCEGRPDVLRNGITNGELRARARGWVAYAICLEGKLEEVGNLSRKAE